MTLYSVSERTNLVKSLGANLTRTFAGTARRNRNKFTANQVTGKPNLGTSVLMPLSSELRTRFFFISEYDVRDE